MKSNASNIGLQYNEEGLPQIILTVRGNIRQEVSELKEIISKGHELAVEIKQYRERRSLDANAYCWVLCQKLAEKIGGTKEDIYKEAIRRAGQFDFVAVADKAADQFIKAWQGKGLGWYAEASESKIEGCKKIMVYYGSSVYDSREMAHLIDYIVSECRAQGIETLPPDELARMKNEWGAK
jgi:hypothetical protein